MTNNGKRFLNQYTWSLKIRVQLKGLFQRFANDSELTLTGWTEHGVGGVITEGIRLGKPFKQCVRLSYIKVEFLFG
jgi:hypothetical protein